MSSLETYFAKFRENIIGVEQRFDSPYGEQKIVMPTGQQAAGCMAQLKRNYRMTSTL